MTLNVIPPVVLGVDGTGQPIAAVIESGRQRWLVSYDGLTASAAPVVEKTR